MEALRVDIEQSKEPRMGARRDCGAIVRLELRRHWSDEDKLAILKETTLPGAIMAVVSRGHGGGTGQLYTWRKQFLRGAVAGFVPAELEDSEPFGIWIAHATNGPTRKHLFMRRFDEFPITRHKPYTGETQPNHEQRERRGESDVQETRQRTGVELVQSR